MFSISGVLSDKWTAGPRKWGNIAFSVSPLQFFKAWFCVRETPSPEPAIGQEAHDFFQAVKHRPKISHLE
jgi:hypothetical protein